MKKLYFVLVIMLLFTFGTVNGFALVADPGQHLKNLGTVKLEAGYGILTSNLCGDKVCSDKYKIGEQIHKTATANPDSYFAGWLSDYCYGIGPCDFTFTGPTTINAVFELSLEDKAAIYINVFGETGGKVTSVPSGIDCQSGRYCSAKFPKGTKVVLTATPLGKFEWRGANCSGAGTCTLTMDRAKVLNVKITK